VAYNNDLMRFDVSAAGKIISLMPHNLYLLQQPSVPAASPARAASPEEKEAAASEVPGVFEYSVGESVEVRWKNTGQELVGKARKVTWHVAVVIAINSEGGVVSSYDVEMPDTFTKQPGAIMRNVCSKHLHKRRKRGKRLKASEQNAESGGSSRA